MHSDSFYEPPLPPSDPGHPGALGDSGGEPSGVPASPGSDLPVVDTPASDEIVAATDTDDENRTRRARSFLAEVAIICVLALVLTLLTKQFITQVYAISGRSMEPTLHDGEMVMIHKLSPSLIGLDRGDLVIFRAPKDANKDLIKRVVALPGDTVEILDNELFVNGELVFEEYILQDAYSRDEDRLTVPPDQIYVLGDNRPQSQDSRQFGPVPLRSVRGEVFLRLWPLRSLTTLP